MLAVGTGIGATSKSCVNSYTNMPRPARKARAPSATSPPINASLRVSKTNTFLNTKKLALHAHAASNKRKASALDGCEDDPDRHLPLGRRTQSFPPSSDEDGALAPSKRACRRDEPCPGVETNTRSRPEGTKGKYLGKVGLARTKTAHKPSASTILSRSKQHHKTTQSKLDVKWRCTETKDVEDTDSSLPPHLAELLPLHKAFLRTVMVQFAHSGNSTPLDFRALEPHLSRTWGKRKVTIADVRRCVAIHSSRSPGTSSPFIVSDYGRGKVCVELGSGYDAAAIDEDRLCKQFKENLQALCAGRATEEVTDMEVPFQSLSLVELPQAAIAQMGTGSQMHPQLAKGERVLLELKGSLVAKQQEKQAAQCGAMSKPTTNPDGSKMSLLDRLRLKQLSKTGESLTPSAPELQRRAALNRVVDVAATISMLSLANHLSPARQAFRMAAILDKLKDSLRMPISRDEGAACVRLIATEVAPEWLRIVPIGGRENVVVQRTGQPLDRVIQERVQKLLVR